MEYTGGIGNCGRYLVFNEYVCSQYASTFPTQGTLVVKISEINITIYPNLLIFSKQTLVPSLLHTKSRVSFLTSLAANNPGNLKQIAQLVLATCRKDTHIFTKGVDEIFLSFCNLAPHHALAIRQLLSGNEMFLETCLKITEQHTGDEVDYLNSIFAVTARWKPVGLENKNIESCLQSLLKRILAGYKAVMNTNCEVDLSNRLRAICILTGLIKGPSFGDTDIQTIFSSIARGQTERFVRLGYCFLIINCDKIHKMSLNRLLSILSFLTSSDTRDPYMTLMLSVYLHTNQVFEIEKLVRQSLSLSGSTLLSVAKENVFTMRNLFLKHDLMDVKRLAKRALDLSASKFRSVSLSVVHALLAGGIIQANGFDISNWVYQQLLNVELPLHPLLPGIIRYYVESIFDDKNRIVRIEDRQLDFVFTRPNAALQNQNPPTITPAKVMFAYYTLLYNDIVFTKKFTGKDYKTDNLPLKQILHVTGVTESEKYKSIYPDLVALAVSQFPELFDVMSVRWEEDKVVRVNPNAQKEWKEAKKFDSSLKPEEWVNVLEHYLSLPPAACISVAPDLIKSFVSRLFLMPRDASSSDSLMESRLASMFLELWNDLNAMVPGELWIMTVNAMMAFPSPSSPGYSQIDIVMDPLLLFRVNRAVFRTPVLFEMFLQMLGGYWIASRYFYLHNYEMRIAPAAAAAAASIAAATNPALGQPQTPTNIPVVKREHIETMLTTQEVSILQLLLEVCLSEKPSTNETDTITTTTAAAKPGISSTESNIHSLVGFFVHKIFVDYPGYIKVVHLQGYPRELIPIAIDKIPSMHVCFDYIPEILALGVSTQNTELQVFGIDLACQLCKKYPIQKSLDMVNNVILPFLKQTMEPVIVALTDIGNLSPEAAKEVMKTRPVNIPNHLEDMVISLEKVAEAFPFLHETIFEKLVGKLHFPLLESKFSR